MQKREKRDDTAYEAHMSGAHYTRRASAYDTILTAVLAFVRVVGGAYMRIGNTLATRVLAPTMVFLIAIWSVIASVATIIHHKAMHILRHVAHVLSRARASRLTMFLVIASVTVLAMCSTIFSVGLEVFLDGESIGFVNSQEEFIRSRSFVEKRASEILERPYSVTPNVRFSLGIVPKEKLLTSGQLESMFFTQITDMSELYVLSVDGETVGASYKRENLQVMLDRLLGVGDPNIKSEFTRDVKIEKKFADVSYLRSYEEIMDVLTGNIHDATTYTVKSGDTLDSIAKSNGMTYADLVALNPGVSQRSLRAGVTLTTSKRLAYLSVKKIRRVEYTQQIGYETKRVSTETLYKGKTSIKTAGVKGQAKVVEDVEYVDNEEVSRNRISYTVMRNPTTQVILVGTKTPPKTVATGKMMRPTGGIISSNYGWRRSGFHRGVDFALAKGSRVSAADGGTVAYAGWKSGGWGYLVIINHGNGLQTYYGHNSSLTVRAGQKVYKGQQIARVGSTGNSSGPHCHFEVHLNGRYVNPWKYIR